MDRTLGVSKQDPDSSHLALKTMCSVNSQLSKFLEVFVVQFCFYMSVMSTFFHKRKCAARVSYTLASFL